MNNHKHQYKALSRRVSIRWYCECGASYTGTRCSLYDIMRLEHEGLGHKETTVENCGRARRRDDVPHDGVD